MVTTSKSMHREVQIKHDLMTHFRHLTSDHLDVAVVTRGKNDINTLLKNPAKTRQGWLAGFGWSPSLVIVGLSGWF